MGSSTTPLPMTLRQSWRSTPQGTSCKHEPLSINDDGVPGVVSAGVARHNGESFREHVDDLALAFVSPLGADYDGSLAFLQMPLLTFT